MDREEYQLEYRESWLKKLQKEAPGDVWLNELTECVVVRTPDFPNGKTIESFQDHLHQMWEIINS